MGILSMIGRFWRDVSGSISLGLDLSISHPSGGGGAASTGAFSTAFSNAYDKP